MISFATFSLRASGRVVAHVRFGTEWRWPGTDLPVEVPIPAACCSMCPDAIVYEGTVRSDVEVANWILDHLEYEHEVRNVFIDTRELSSAWVDRIHEVLGLTQLWRARRLAA